MEQTIAMIGLLVVGLLNVFALIFAFIKFFSHISDYAKEKAEAATKEANLLNRVAQLESDKAEYAELATLLNKIEHIEKNKVDSMHFELLKKDVDYIKIDVREIKELIHQVLKEVTK